MPLTKAPKRRLRKGLENKVVATSERATPSSQPQKVPVEFQQQTLDLFKDACSESLKDSLAGTIQEIKQHLFKRDFAGAFGKAAYLEAYAARWSPTRALTYLDILSSSPILSDQLLEAIRQGRKDLGLQESDKSPIGDTTSGVSNDTTRCHSVISIGAGGGAELVAFAGTLRQLQARDMAKETSIISQRSLIARLDYVAVDIANWSPFLQKLQSSVTGSSPASHENSIASKSTNVPLVTASGIAMRVVQQDILEAWQDNLRATLAGATLVTIMFTLNELYNTSMASTTRMLLSLTSLLKTGALLLVVDSPSDYSTVNLGKSSENNKDPADETKLGHTPNKYPMQWLLDHTLLETATIIDSDNKHCKQWTKLDSSDSKWFRLSPQLKYPIDLEDVRYQMHLYQRL